MNREIDTSFKDPLPAVLISDEYELFINAPLATTWEKMIAGMDSWWCHRFKDNSRVVVDPRVMGRWEELFDDKGNGALYGYITYVDPPNVFAVVGQFGMFGAVSTGGVWKLREHEGGTMISTRGEMMGHFPPELLEGRKSGRTSLFVSLRRWVEEGVDWRDAEEMNK